MARKMIAQTYQDAVLSGLAVPTLRGAFAVCRREGSIVLNGNWFMDKAAVLLPDKRDVLLYLVDRREDLDGDLEALAERSSGVTVYNMKELLWVNAPSLNAKAVDADTGEPFGFDLIFRTTTLTLTESTVFDDAELANSTHQLQQVLLNWKPLVRSANLLKINRFGAEQKRWFMLENNVDLSWYKNRFAVNSRNAVRIDTLLKVTVPSTNPKAKKFPLSADLIFSEFKKDKTYHLAASGEPGSVDLLQHIISHWTIEDLEMSGGGEGAAADDDRLVCFIDVHVKTINSKLAQSPEDFGMQCKVFGPEPRAPKEWAGQAEPHVRVVDFLTPLDGHLGPVERAGMWMHDAILTVDGHKISNLPDLTRATVNRSAVRIRVARLPFRRNVEADGWGRVVGREKARRLTLGYQRDWDSGKGGKEAKRHSQERHRRHKKAEFRQLAARERDDDPIPGSSRRVRLNIRRTLTARHQQLLEEDAAVDEHLGSPRLSQVPPPHGPPPLDFSGAQGAAGRRVHRTRVDVAARRGLGDDGSSDDSGDGGGGGSGAWTAAAPPGSPFATLRVGMQSPANAPRPPRTPGGPPIGGPETPRTLADAAASPAERTRILSDAGRALFGASQKTFRLDDGEHGGGGGGAAAAGTDV